MSHDRGCPCGRERYEYEDCPENDCYKKSKPVEIGGNPLPKPVQIKLGEFLEWLDTEYSVDNGSTALYWHLSHEIAKRLENNGNHD